jgi:hypothetical protein
MVTWGADRTLLFDNTQPPIQIGKNASRNSGGSRRQTRRRKSLRRRKQTHKRQIKRRKH